MSGHLQHEKVWVDKPMYDKAERQYYENLAKDQLTPLAEEVAKARQRLIEIKHSYNDGGDDKSNEPVDKLHQQIASLKQIVNSLQSTMKTLEKRLSEVEKNMKNTTDSVPMGAIPSVKKEVEEDDDVDLFGSDSDGEDSAAIKVREERLAAYNEKKSKKPALIAKSSILLDVKPWDDETDMKAMEEAVRKIQIDGLLWGTAKLAPLAYGIHKLQILCIIEDEKVSVDWLQEQIQDNEDYVQSVDIAAFNKI